MKTAVLLSVGLGLLAGYIYGDELRRRKHAEEYVDELTKQIDKASLKTPLPEAQLNKMAAVLNDAHKQITTVSKALRKPAA
jgi:hypothetical protein